MRTLARDVPIFRDTDAVEAYDFERISFTALGPVIGRGEFSDIPFAKEILDYIKATVIDGLQTLGDPSALPSAEFLKGTRDHAAFFEARFKAVSRILVERQATQIVELASGFSPRALDPAFHGTQYVEVDLPKMILRKREIVTALLGSIPAHLQFCTASVLDRDELSRGLAHLGKAPVAVIAEGLLRYLTFEEKIVLAENVRHILSTHGGVWITPDIHLRRWAPERKPEDGIDWNFQEQLGRDLNPNYFDSFAQARSFFEGCGFRVEEQPLLQGIRERVASLSLSSPELLAELEHRRIFTMTLDLA
jgi:O-methyltransferase involved in polyketide biosynthesis